MHLNCVGPVSFCSILNPWGRGGGGVPSGGGCRGWWLQQPLIADMDGNILCPHSLSPVLHCWHPRTTFDWSLDSGKMLFSTSLWNRSWNKITSGTGLWLWISNQFCAKSLIKTHHPKATLETLNLGIWPFLGRHPGNFCSRTKGHLGIKRSPMSHRCQQFVSSSRALATCS